MTQGNNDSLLILTLVDRAEDRIRRTEHALMYWPTNLRGRENRLDMCPGPNGKTANITLKSVYKLQMCSRHNKLETKKKYGIAPL